MEIKAVETALKEKNVLMDNEAEKILTQRKVGDIIHQHHTFR